MIMSHDPSCKFQKFRDQFVPILYIYVSVNSKLTIPRAKPPGNFFEGANCPPPGKKGVQTPPQAYKNELKPHPRGHFPQLFAIKTLKK